MAEEITPEEQILLNALAPKRASGDSGSAEQHSIEDQLAALAAARQASAAVSRRGGFNVRMSKFIPPGMDD
jgi:hypothetical protein